MTCATGIRTVSFSDYPALFAASRGEYTAIFDDVCGRGAFIKNVEQARELASTMVGLGVSHGVATVAQLTSMNSE